MRDRSACSRTGLNSGFGKSPETDDTRIRVNLSHLRSLENLARGLRLLPRQPAGSVLNGRHASRLRGRGLNFEELRGYLAGDDPRTIDWKVTARTGRPHVRVYNEERDRPALLVVDQRMSMFFGTRHNMKSVTAAEAAALVAFRILDQGDRVGGIIFGDDFVSEIRPKRSRIARDQLLSSLERANRLLQADAPAIDTPMPLNLPLESVARMAKRDHLVVVFSDFDGIDTMTEKLVSSIARHNDLVLCPITDPISKEIPENTKLVVSDGELQVEIDTAAGETLKRLEQFSTGRLADLLRWQRRYGLPVLPLNSGDNTADQLRSLTGHGSGKRGAQL